jgi:hypothetical protein
MKDRLRTARSRPCEIARFDLPHFCLNISIFFLRWAAAAAVLMFSAVCSAGYITYAPVEKWSDETNDHFLGTNKCVLRNSGLRDSPEELCQCHADRENRDVPAYRHDFIRFTMYPELWNPNNRLDSGQQGYCTYRIEYVANPSAYTNEYTGPAVQHKYCLDGGDLSLLAGELACVKTATDLSLSFVRDKPRRPANESDKKIPLIARVTDNVTGSPVVYHNIDFTLALPGTLTLSGDSQPSNRFNTGNVGQVLLDYSKGQTKGNVQVITASCAGCKEPVELKIGPTPVIGFFNGVWNTRNQASDGLKALKELVGLKYEGTDLRYENFYNQTGTGNGNTALQDIAEVFIQRGKELDGVLNNRWEHYWELLAGKHAEGDSLTARLLNGLGNGASALAGLFDATFNAMLGQIFSGYSQMLSNPPHRSGRGGSASKA